MRELTQEHTALLKALLDRPPLVAEDGGSGLLGVPPHTPSPPPPPAHPSHAHSPPAHPAAPSALEFLLAAAPDAATAGILTASAVLWWPDESVGRAASVCRAAVPLVSAFPTARALIAGDMLRGALTALACQSAASAQAEALALVRDILCSELAGGAPDGGAAARATLLESLPRASGGSVDALAARLGASASDRDQRAAVKKFLTSSGGEALAAALADWRPSGAAAGAAAAAAAAAASSGGVGGVGGRRRRKGRGGSPLEGLAV